MTHTVFMCGWFTVPVSVRFWSWTVLTACKLYIGINIYQHSEQLEQNMWREIGVEDSETIREGCFLSYIHTAPISQTLVK